MSSLLTPDRLGQALQDGMLIAIPAPCGWMAMARAGERDRLLRLSGVDKNEISLTAGNVASLHEFLPPHGLRVQRLIARLLPGPVAIRLGASGPRIRLPAHPLWEPLAACRSPLLAVPLPNEGDEPASIQSIASRWSELIAVDDATPGKRCVEDARLTVEKGNVTIERSGSVAKAQLEEAIRLRLLCVCSGNTCRSPMLMTLLRAACARRGIEHLVVESAGTYARRGQSASDEAALCMQNRGLELKAHKSRPIDVLDLSWYDRIVCVGPSHATVLKQLGAKNDQLYIVNADSGGVPDPFGHSYDVYEECAGILEKAAERIADDI
jgi:protein-tyrosine-phosphatase